MLLGLVDHPPQFGLDADVAAKSNATELTRGLLRRRFLEIDDDNGPGALPAKSLT